MKAVQVFGGMSDPSHMAILPDGSVFAIEQWSGKVHLFTPGKGSSLAGTVPTNAGRNVEDGMLGIVADLNYPTTKWIYILHTPETLGSNRLTRYSVINGALANPKKIMEYPRIITPGKQNDQRHAGGGMDWNRKTGDLFIATGDDTNPFGDRSVYGPRDPSDPAYSALRTSANTNDLRGKSLRIRPLPFPDTQTPAVGVGSTYAIPEGNLFPIGKSDAAKTRPEIYSMGHRNAYRVKVDSVTGWAFVGEVGADADDYDSLKGPPGYDKITLIQKPSNAGWPFTNGNLEPYKVRSYETAYLAAGYTAGQPFDLNALKNLSPVNTGLTDLLPPVPPLIYYSTKALQKGLSSKLGGGGETVIAGPTYNFNPSLASGAQLPPFFHRKVIFGDFSRHNIWAMTLDATGTLTALDKVWDGPNVIDMDIAPDGTLYYLDYGAGAVYSLQYTGSQKDHKSCSFIKVGCMDPKFKEFDASANLNDPSLCATQGVGIRAFGPVRSRKDMILVSSLAAGAFKVPDWASGLELYDLAGKRIFTASFLAAGHFELPRTLSNRGLIYVQFIRK